MGPTRATPRQQHHARETGPREQAGVSGQAHFVFRTLQTLRFFYKLTARPSASKKITTHFIVTLSLWRSEAEPAISLRDACVRVCKMGMMTAGTSQDAVSFKGTGAVKGSARHLVRIQHGGHCGLLVTYV